MRSMICNCNSQTTSYRYGFSNYAYITTYGRPILMSLWGIPNGVYKKESRKHLCIFDGAETGILLENEDNLEVVDSLWCQIIKVNYIDFENARDILFGEDIIESLAPPEWISLLKDIFMVFNAQWCLPNSLLHRTIQSRIHQHRLD